MPSKRRKARKKKTVTTEEPMTLSDRELEGRPHSKLTTTSHARVRRTELVAALNQLRFWLKAHPSLRTHDDILVRIIDGTLELERSVPHKVGVSSLFGRRIPATHDRPGTVAIPLAKLLRLCKSLESEFVDLGFSKPPASTSRAPTAGS